MNSPTQEHAITLARLDYRRLPTPFASADSCALQAMRRLAACVGDAAATFAQRAGGAFDYYAMGSTLGSYHLSDPDSHRDTYKRLVAQHAGREPAPAVTAYECTNWAFLIRDGLARSRALNRPQRVLLQIVDCDLHGVQAAWKTRTYGNAGFGMLSMDVQLDHRAALPDIHIDSAPVSASMITFGSRLRAMGRTHTDARISAPFFPEPTRGAFRKTVAGLNSLPDHHDSYGHCFGCDPWIGIGLAHDPDSSTPDQRYVVGSLALNGYHAIGVVGVAAHAECRVERP